METKLMFTPGGLVVTVTNKSTVDKEGDGLKEEAGEGQPSAKGGGGSTMTFRYSRMADPWTLKKKKMLQMKKLGVS